MSSPEEELSNEDMACQYLWYEAGWRPSVAIPGQWFHSINYPDVDYSHIPFEPSAHEILELIVSGKHLTVPGGYKFVNDRDV